MNGNTVFRQRTFKQLLLVGFTKDFCQLSNLGEKPPELSTTAEEKSESQMFFFLILSIFDICLFEIQRLSLVNIQVKSLPKMGFNRQSENLRQLSQSL